MHFPPQLLKFVRLTIPAPKDCVRELDMTSSNPPRVVEVSRTSAKTLSSETEAFAED